jgi:hypothetical protein
MSDLLATVTWDPPFGKIAAVIEAQAASHLYPLPFITRLGNYA